MKYRTTIVIEYDSPGDYQNVQYGAPLFGGKICGIASYDAMHVADIAIPALSSSADPDCKAADDAIEEYLFESYST